MVRIVLREPCGWAWLRSRARTEGRHEAVTVRPAQAVRDAERKYGVAASGAGMTRSLEAVRGTSGDAAKAKRCDDRVAYRAALRALAPPASGSELACPRPLRSEG